MEAMVIGPGGKGPEQIIALYIMSLMMSGRLDISQEPSRESIMAELTKDVDTIFQGYEAAANEALNVTDAEIVSETPDKVQLS